MHACVLERACVWRCVCGGVCGVGGGGGGEFLLCTTPHFLSVRLSMFPSLFLFIFVLYFPFCVRIVSREGQALEEGEEEILVYKTRHLLPLYSIFFTLHSFISHSFMLIIVFFFRFISEKSKKENSKIPKMN